MQLTYILALLFSVIVAMFAIVNAQPVKVDFMFQEFQISLALIVLISAFAGAAILGFLGLFKQIKSGFELRGAKGKNKKMEVQIEELENKLTETENNITEKGEALREMEEKFADKEKVLEELESRLLEKEKRINELEEELGIQAENEDEEKNDKGDKEN